MLITRKYLSEAISNIDPGHLALKRSIKTFIVILISMAIFWKTPGMAMFAAISSMLFSRSQFGFTMQERRFTMLTTGILMSLLSIPVSLISQSHVGALVFVISFSFLIFFLIGNRVVPDFPAVTLLAMSVVEMAFSHTLKSGIQYGGLFLLCTILVYAIHFLIWPTRPRKRLKSQIEIIIANLEDYRSSIIAEYKNAEYGMQLTQEKSDIVRKSLGDFRRLWQLFSVKSDGKSSTEARYMDIYIGLGKIYEYHLLLWQFRVSAWDSDIYKSLVTEEKKVHKIIKQLIHRHDPNLLKPSNINLKTIQDEIESMGLDYLDQIKTAHSLTTHREWVAVINTIKALEALAADLERVEFAKEIDTPAFSVSRKFSSFFKLFKNAFKNFRISNPAFRLGVRSALIIGSTMAYSVFFRPEFGYWLVLFSVLLIRPNLGISIKVGKERFLGTVAGSVLALGFIVIVPAGHAVYYIFMLASAFFMIWFINLDRMIPMVTAMTFMIICLFYLTNPDGNHLVWLRISYTAAIVLLVIFLSFLLWPERARKRFATSLANALALEQSFFIAISKRVISGESGHSSISSAERQNIRNGIQQFNDVIDATRNEILQEKVIAHGINIRSYIMRLLNTLQSLESTSQSCDFHKGFEKSGIELSAFSKSIIAAFESLTYALQNRTQVSDYPDLESDFDKLRSRFRETKYEHGEISDNITQFWNNSTFIWNLKPLMLELDGIRNEIELKMKGE